MARDDTRRGIRRGPNDRPDQSAWGRHVAESADDRVVNATIHADQPHRIQMHLPTEVVFSLQQGGLQRRIVPACASRRLTMRSRLQASWERD